ncbi:hypothetical protein BT93_L3595 [Corymbia citriodora subsp. variegata]|uniref:Uncharacterized protein n=1 Tax=Corymbia citriodora subsp. variegata TaxID=360336 RepID=A0A8T0CM72_CORYI|nr:hypothetical protein BT93_L3595 [Corymbia citriodora subsp. variegata]
MLPDISLGVDGSLDAHCEGNRLLETEQEVCDRFGFRNEVDAVPGLGKTGQGIAVQLAKSSYITSDAAIRSQILSKPQAAQGALHPSLNEGLIAGRQGDQQGLFKGTNASPLVGLLPRSSFV